MGKEQGGSRGSQRGGYWLKSDHVVFVHLVRTLNFSMSEMESHGRGRMSREIYNMSKGFKGVTLASE